MSELICTYGENASASCPKRGVEFCTDCCKEAEHSESDMKVGLAIDCEIENPSLPTHDCPDCSCRPGHEEGFVACGPDHKALQMMEAAQ